jgi:hypothetical protein
MVDDCGAKVRRRGRFWAGGKRENGGGLGKEIGRLGKEFELFGKGIG